MKQNNPNNRSAIPITHGTDTLTWTHAIVRYATKTTPTITIVVYEQFVYWSWQIWDRGGEGCL